MLNEQLLSFSKKNALWRLETHEKGQFVSQRSLQGMYQVAMATPLDAL